MLNGEKATSPFLFATLLQSANANVLFAFVSSFSSASDGRGPGGGAGGPFVGELALALGDVEDEKGVPEAGGAADAEAAAEVAASVGVEGSGPHAARGSSERSMIVALGLWVFTV